MKFPGCNVIALCESALKEIVQEALNARSYDNKENPVRVLGVKARIADQCPVFDVQVTTDSQEMRP